MYVKIKVSSRYVGTSESFLYEVHDGFDPENNQDDAKELGRMEEEAVWAYAETSYELISGDMEEDEDY